MNSLDKRLQMSGFITFFLSGICSISSGIVVSLLQERYGFDYNVTGTLLSIMSIGNLMAGFATGVLPAKIGLKATIITLSAGYELGYLWLGISGWMSILVLSFLLTGFAKGSVINMCTILVAIILKTVQKHEHHAFLLCLRSSDLPLCNCRGRTDRTCSSHVYFRLFRTYHVDHFPSDTI